MNEPNTTGGNGEAVATSVGFGVWNDAGLTKPRANQKVLISGTYSTGKQWRAIGKWTDGKSWDATYWDECPEEWWDEAGDEATVPEGWWEYSVEVEEICPLKNVTHWMKLPEMPNI